MNAIAANASTLYLGKYEAQRLLGEGGMGKVFLGRRLEDGHPVVIKVMHDHIAADPRVRQSFAREMDLMTRFRHPYAVTLFEASLDPPPCIVMEYVPGDTLEALLHKHGRMQPARMGRILGQLCLALYAAHGMGILHRDLTPANLMVSDPGPREKIKVMDFGLARLGEGIYIPLEKLTGNGNSIGGGTPDYVCPEQLRADAVDGRGDLYSVGVLLFKALTGRLPFESAGTTEEILAAHLHQAPPRFAQVGVHDVPPAVEAVVQTLLCKYPAERPADAKDLAERFGQALGQSIAAPSAFIVPTPQSVSAPAVNSHIIDRLEAWMPEQIAVVKLRGFVHEVGGEITASEPGLIRVQLPDPRTPPAPQAKSFLGFLGFGRKTLTNPIFLHLELHLAKKQVGPKNLLEITVVLCPEKDKSRQEEQMRREFSQRLCRELRAFVMSGR